MTGSRSAAGVAWVAAQEPPAPAALVERVGGALAACDVAREAAHDAAHTDDATRPTRCLAAAEAVLARLLADGATGTRSREAALDLLAADALVTYAFEAASEAPAALPALARDAIARLAAAGAVARAAR
jgi:hypothetical protein